MKWCDIAVSSPKGNITSVYWTTIQFVHKGRSPCLTQCLPLVVSRVKFLITLYIVHKTISHGRQANVKQREKRLGTNEPAKKQILWSRYWVPMSWTIGKRWSSTPATYVDQQQSLSYRHCVVIKENLKRKAEVNISYHREFHTESVLLGGTKFCSVGRAFYLVKVNKCQKYQMKLYCRFI